MFLVLFSFELFYLDDQSEINEYLKYQRIIRELKDENYHLRDETENLRKSLKAKQSEINQVELLKRFILYFLEKNKYICLSIEEKTI